MYYSGPEAHSILFENYCGVSSNSTENCSLKDFRKNSRLCLFERMESVPEKYKNCWSRYFEHVWVCEPLKEKFDMYHKSARAVYSVEMRGLEQSGQYVHVLVRFICKERVLGKSSDWMEFWISFSLLKVRIRFR